MNNYKFITASYEESDTIKKQGSKTSIQRYLKNGYTIVEERFGFWVLSKPVTITVWLEKPTGEIVSTEMKQNIVKHYGKLKISEKLFYQFVSDAKRGIINFNYDSIRDYYYIS